MATYGELQALIARNLVRPDLNADQTVDLPDDTIQYYIKDAIDYYSSQRYFFLEATANINITTGIPTASFPADFNFDIIDDGMVITQPGYQRKLVRITYPQMTSLRSDIAPTLTGTPEYYAIYNNLLQFYPTPNFDLVATMDYYKKLPELVNSGDSNAWTTTGRRLIVARATADIYTFRGQKPDLAQPFYALAQDEESRLRNMNARRQDVGFFILPTYYG